MTWRAGGALLLLVGLAGGGACRRAVVPSAPEVEVREGQACTADSDCGELERCREKDGARTCRRECEANVDCPAGALCDARGTCQRATPPQ